MSILFAFGADPCYVLSSMLHLYVLVINVSVQVKLLRDLLRKSEYKQISKISTFTTYELQGII